MVPLEYAAVIQHVADIKGNRGLRHAGDTVQAADLQHILEIFFRFLRNAHSEIESNAPRVPQLVFGLVDRPSLAIDFRVLEVDRH